MGGLSVKIEKLTDEMTEKITGGSKRKVKTVTRKLIEVPEVECINCSKYFRTVITYDRPIYMDSKEYLELQKKRRTCPHCGYVNIQYQIFRSNTPQKIIFELDKFI